MSAPLSVWAISAAPITSGLVPYKLVKRTRTISPPRLTCTTSRRVAPVNTASAGLACASTKGADAQVPTHLVASGLASDGCTETAAARARIRLRLILGVLVGSPTRNTQR